MTKIREIIIHLHHIPHMTRSMFRRLLQLNAFTAIFTSSPSDLQELLQLNKGKANRLYHAIHDDRTYQRVKETKAYCKIITFFDELYPHQLRYIPDFPFVLYGIGNTHLLKSKKIISIVGTRRPSNEGREKTRRIVKPLVQADWIIASGFARGIDSYAHRMTLAEGGHTIAILGGGFHFIYPKEHHYLFQLMSQKGLVLTEYPPFMKPRKYFFPERNRIISGIAQSTILIEAKERSGSLITIDQALEQGKDVYVVPGSPLQEQAEGCNMLIQEGAQLVLNGEDILRQMADFSPL
ncbi:MAG TPA: DNA-processing protein DprA [Pseudogracilibacillus sp.]|nr:DNA-processing protein DprA [Pseudogracilibacillus sp.]